MPSLILKRYCGCCQLHTGGLIIAWVSVVYTIISIITSISRLSQVSDAVDEINELQVEFANKTYENEDSFNTQLKENKEAAEQITRVFYAIYIAMIIMGLINVIPDILLIMGIRKRNGKYLIPWLSIRGFEFVICFLILLVLVLIILPTGFWNIMTIFLVVGFIIYHWLVIYSLYLQYTEGYDNYHTHDTFPSVAMKV